MRVFCDRTKKHTDIRRPNLRGKKLCQHCGHPIKTGHRLHKSGGLLAVTIHGMVIDLAAF